MPFKILISLLTSHKAIKIATMNYTLHKFIFQMNALNQIASNPLPNKDPMWPSQHKVAKAVFSLPETNVLPFYIYVTYIKNPSKSLSNTLSPFR